MKDKAMDRFKHKAAEMKITFIPQCIKCVKNIDIISCKEFKDKPNEYRNNQKDCPRIEKRDVN